MRGSCHLDKSSNVEIDVKCWNWCRMLRYRILIAYLLFCVLLSQKKRRYCCGIFKLALHLQTSGGSKNRGWSCQNGENIKPFSFLGSFGYLLRVLLFLFILKNFCDKFWIWIYETNFVSNSRSILISF